MGCGIFVADSKSQINARECKLEENGNCGALVTGGGSLALHLCEVIEHMRGAGAVVHGRGSLVDLQESTIVGCGAVGLMAFDGCRIQCKRVSISFASEHGVEVRSRRFMHMGLLLSQHQTLPVLALVVCTGLRHDQSSMGCRMLPCMLSLTAL